MLSKSAVSTRTIRQSAVANYQLATVIPNRAEGAVRACPEQANRAEGKLLFQKKVQPQLAPHKTVRECAPAGSQLKHTMCNSMGNRAL
jgi:hypothetical protein